MKKFYDHDFKLGVLGGGQLGRMLIQEALKLDVHISVLDPSDDAPCAKLASSFVKGDFNDYNTVYHFGQGVDLITIEIENVNVDALLALQSEGKKIYPKPDNLRIIKDKGLQKQFYADNGIATSSFRLIKTPSEITSFPVVQKLRTGGYDGKGVQILKSPSDLNKAFSEPSVLEELVDIDKEISIVISRSPSGEVKSFPLVELEYNPVANLVEFLFAPADVSEAVRLEAQKLAASVVDKLDFIGILAVELFVTPTGDVMVNEIAPRTHNSGHHSIESCYTSQFEQHLRAILDLPLGNTDLIQPAVMLNILGEEGFKGHVIYNGIEDVLKLKGAHIHIYGKKVTSPFRKMGHITVVNSELEGAKNMAKQIKKDLKVIA